MRETYWSHLKQKNPQIFLTFYIAISLKMWSTNLNLKCFQFMTGSFRYFCSQKFSSFNVDFLAKSFALSQMAKGHKTLDNKITNAPGKIGEICPFERTQVNQILRFLKTSNFNFFLQKLVGPQKSHLKLFYLSENAYFIRNIEIFD